MYFTKKELEEIKEKNREQAIRKKNEWTILEKRFNMENSSNRLEQFINLSGFEYNNFNASYYFDLFLTLADFKDNNFSNEKLKEVKYYSENKKAIVIESPAAVFTRIISSVNYDNNLYTKLLKSLVLLSNEKLYEKWFIINEKEALLQDDSQWERLEDFLNSYPNKVELYKFELIKVYSSLNSNQIKELHSFIIENNNVPKNYFSLDMKETLNLLKSLASQDKANEALDILSFLDVDFNIYENSSWLTYSKSYDFLKKVINSLNLNPTKFNEEFMKDIALKPYIKKFTELRNSFSSNEEILIENALSVRNMLLSNKKQVVIDFIEENKGKIDFATIFKDNNFTLKFFSDNKYWLWKYLEDNNIKNIDNVFYGNTLLEMAMRRPSLNTWKYKNMFFDELEHIVNMEAFEVIINKLPNYLRSLCKENMDSNSNHDRINMSVTGDDRPSYYKYSGDLLYNNSLLNCIFNSNANSPVFYHDSKTFLNVLKSKNVINDDDIDTINKQMNRIYQPLSFCSGDLLVNIVKNEFFLELVLLDSISKNNNQNLDFHSLIESVDVYEPIKKYENSGRLIIPRTKFSSLVINSILEVSDNIQDSNLKNLAMNKMFYLFNKSVKIKEKHSLNKNEDYLFEDLYLMYLSFNNYSFNFVNLNKENLNELNYFVQKVDDLISSIKENSKIIKSLDYSPEQINLMLDYFSTNSEKVLMNKEIVANNSKKRVIKF